jgi:peptidase M1-like protein
MFATSKRIPVLIALLALLLGVLSARMQEPGASRFAQLRDLLPTPNAYRTASGAPGHAYWQQQVDYQIDVHLDPKTRRISGQESIRYQNNSPDDLHYLWLQLDANRKSPDSHAVRTTLAPNMESPSLQSLSRVQIAAEFEGGFDILAVKNAAGSDLHHTIVDTTMRVDLPGPLLPGQSFEFEVEWTYVVNDTSEVRGRSGAEHLDDGTWIYGLAQWYPRLCAYTDYAGWQHKEFLGGAEFTLEFGDYDVRITVPEDHVVASTGLLMNSNKVLNGTQRERLSQAAESDRPILVVTREESDLARSVNQKNLASAEKIWHYQAQAVRDFAWASSPAFLWDAMAVPNQPDGEKVLCMSYWPREGDPLWGMYSTHAVAHTIEVYGERTFPYPYPVAISVNGVVGGGMEYPMLCFNGPRPEADGTYSARTKYGLISVIIHEVGHNWFPMMVNSDERQWTWMDEGLNTFLQYQAEKEWQARYPSRSGEPGNIVNYMVSEDQVPIMSNGDTLLHGGSNAYAKPATALNILRETIMGREGFDFAFKTYARRWAFKRPEPADLFRTMEDASGVDLDWYFRNWFFTTDHVDLALTAVHHYTLESDGPVVEAVAKKSQRQADPVGLTETRNQTLPKRLDRYPELADFYNSYDALTPTESDIARWQKFSESLSEAQRKVLAADLQWYVVDVQNLGGIPMPIILRLDYQDGSHEIVRIPTEIWRKDVGQVSKLLMCDRPLQSITLDPYHEIADADTSNNLWPPKIESQRVAPRAGNRPRSGNPMQKSKRRP